MSHFAEIDKDGIVQQVIVAEQDFINSGLIGDSFNWVQTSYNGIFRGSFANVGDVYDKEKDIFRPVQPYPSWTFNLLCISILVLLKTLNKVSSFSIFILT